MWGRHIAIYPHCETWFLLPTNTNPTYGLVEEQGRKLFVTGGVGAGIVPVRFRVKPEVVILTLIPED